MSAHNPALEKTITLNTLHRYKKEGQKIDGDQDTIVFSGTVKADGTADLKLFETAEDWNDEKTDNA